MNQSQSDDQFAKELEELERMLVKLPEPKLEYRLYYDAATGQPFAFSMEEHPGVSYILVTKEQYDTLSTSNIRVINGKIIPESELAKPRVSSMTARTLRNDMQFIIGRDEHNR